MHCWRTAAPDTAAPPARTDARLPVCRARAGAGLNCLMQHYQVPASVLPVAQQPSLVLSAEAELGITAGLQDRVIQASESAREACVRAT